MLAHQQVFRAEHADPGREGMKTRPCGTYRSHRVGGRGADGGAPSLPSVEACWRRILVRRDVGPLTRVSSAARMGLLPTRTGALADPEVPP